MSASCLATFVPGDLNVIGQKSEEVKRFKDFIEKMEVHQGQFESNWSRYVCHQIPVEFNTSSNLLCKELKSSSEEQEGYSDSFSGIRSHPDQAKMKTCSNHSYVMDARLRLENLKAGGKSSQPLCSVKEMLSKNHQNDLLKKEEPDTEESALDLVELLDVEQDVKSEESW